MCDVGVGEVLMSDPVSPPLSSVQLAGTRLSAEMTLSLDSGQILRIATPNK